MTIGHGEPEYHVPCARQLVERQAVRSDGVPDAEESDVGSPILSHGLRGCAIAGDGIAQGAERHFYACRRAVTFAIALEGLQRAPLELGVVRRCDETLVRDQAAQHADGEGTAAEAERVDAIARFVVAAKKRIEIEDVALQAPAERATEYGSRPERRGADAVVVIRDLARRAGARRRQRERLIHPPYVGLEELARAVAGAVGQQDDILGHATPPPL